ncbi:UPF0505 protein C16orf62 isogeny [Sesbania bispinosa]|nr:UPF0505 protein C16orf62 isogeny [Sesbania bispinosa]
MEFRPRNYSAENESHALPRVRADVHPLTAPPPPVAQVNVVVNRGNTDFFDPLRGTDDDAKATPPDPDNLGQAANHQPTKEWTSFRRLLMQSYNDNESSLSMGIVVLYASYVMSQFSAHEKSSTSMHLEELDDPQRFADEGVKVITWQEYVSRLHELKEEITRSWLSEDRVTSLKLSIKVNF